MDSSATPRAETKAPEGSGENEEEVLLYQNFTSSPDVSFWKELARRKLDVLGLDDAAIPVTATFRVTSRGSGAHADLEADAAGHSAPPLLLELSASSFAQELKETAASDGEGHERGAGGRQGEGDRGGDSIIPSVVDAARVPGLLYNFNTVEAFKKADKNRILRDCMRSRLERIAASSVVSASEAEEEEEEEEDDDVEAAERRLGAFQDPATLAQFVVLGYADLKKHTFV